MGKKIECCPSMEIPECCDMRGMLSFLILWLLSTKPMHGQEIAKELEKRRGIKPSPGTIYPALKDLKKKGWIEGKREGRTVVYSLTEKAQGDIENACKYFCRVFFDIFAEYREKST